LRTADDGIKYTKNGLSLFNVLSEIFRRCIKLKHRLSLSKYDYEVYFPASLESRFISTELEDQGRQIKFCFAPAILEYDPEMFEMNGSHGCVYLASKSLSMQQVSKGKRAGSYA
jgi:hypothetical protein